MFFNNYFSVIFSSIQSNNVSSRTDERFHQNILRTYYLQHDGLLGNPVARIESIYMNTKLSKRLITHYSNLHTFITWTGIGKKK